MALDSSALENPAAGDGGVTVERLLVRAPNWLGDAVLSLAAVRDLRRRNFPQARIEVLARPWVADLYRAVPEIDAVRPSLGTRADAAALRGAFDTAVLLPNSFASALTVFLAGIPERWGYARDGRSLLLTRHAALRQGTRGRSELYYYRAMLAGLDLLVSATPDCTLACPGDWRGRAGETLGPGRWVGLNPGAFYGSAKRWLPERYAAVADRLARTRGVQIAILGGAAERPLAQAIAGQMQAPARILAGETTLPELVGVLSRLELLVTNDSGPMHVASALGVPVLALFGPTDWRETAPVGAASRVLREPVPCAPCKLRECPIDHRCMLGVSVERVAGAAEGMLA
jgi:heptosyltransferase-2